MSVRSQTIAAGLAAGVVAMVASGADVTYVWQGGQAANAPTNAYLWTTDSNWDKTPYPNAANAVVRVNDSVNATKYIRMPDDLTVKDLRSGPYTTRWLGERVTMTALGYTSYGGRTGVLYADKITSPSEFLVGTSDFAADLDVAQLTATGDRCGIRMDLYATSAEPGRTNVLGDLQKITQGSGNPSFYAPNGTSEQTAQWNQTAGSPFLMRVSAKINLSVGTTVTGEGIPEGTFLRRNFEDGWIELSKPVTSTLAGNTLTFAAFTPNVYQHVAFYDANGGANGRIQTGKIRTQDTAVLEIDKFNTNGKNQGIDAVYYYLPWHVILHAVNYNSGNRNFGLGVADLEFAARTDGGTPGIPEHNVFFTHNTGYNIDSSVSFTVGEGLSASILSVSNLVGTVTKKGAGTLVTTLSENTAANVGTLVVEDGVFEILGALGGETPYVKAVTVKAGGTLKLDATLRVDRFVAEPGATVAGPGSLDLSNADLSDLPAGVIFTDGASPVMTLPGGALLKDRPGTVTTADLGNPAFWFNTDNPDRDMVYEVVGSTTNVTRWNDCRGTDAKYNFMTNLYQPAELRERIPYGSSTMASYLYRPGVMMTQGGVGKITNSHGMIWASTVTGIRSVFVVKNHEPTTANAAPGGALLGWWGAGKGDFARTSKPLFSSEYAAKNVIDGDCYINGTKVAWDYSMSFSFDYSSGGEFASLVENHPVREGASANAMGYCGSDTYLDGGEFVYECLVYTNELTYAERMKVREYLSAKWFKTGANAAYVREPNRVPAVDAAMCPTLTIAAGAGSVGKLTASGGTFVKKGAGDLLIEDCVAPSATVSAEAGTLYLKSYALTRDGLPCTDGIHLHLDATETNSITWKTIDGKGDCVSKWKTVRGPNLTRQASAVCQGAAPLHKLVDAASAGKLTPGMPMVDMGPFFHETRSGYYGQEVVDGKAQFLTFPEEKLMSVFLVMGSAQGGGQPIGWSGRWDNYWTGGWQRDTSGWALDDPATHVCESSTLPRCFQRTDRTLVRLNGTDIDRFATGFSGDYDILTATTFTETIKANSFACSHYQNNIGGMELGEAILSTKWHSPEQVKHVEAYLRKKWFGGETDGYRQAKVGTLSVAAGATVESIGDAPVVVGAIAGGGTVNAPIAFAAESSLAVAVASDGSVGLLTLSGAVDFGMGGTVSLTGDLAKLAPGRYEIAVSEGIAPGQTWRAEPSSTSRFDLRLHAENGRLVMVVALKGTFLIVR